MELGEALKYFFSKAEIIINHCDFININLLSHFPLLKSGYASFDTIKNILSLYIKINKLNKENKVIVDDLFLKSFNGLIPVNNYKLVGNKYCHLIYLYEYIIKYEKFEHINSLIYNDYLDPINCPEPLKLRYNDLINAINEHDLLNVKDCLSVKDIYIKHYKKYDIEINTFDFLKGCCEEFDYKILDSHNIKAIIDLNVTTKEINTCKSSKENVRLAYELDVELRLSNELIRILRLIEQDNVFGAAIIRNNNSHVKIIDHDFSDLNYYLMYADNVYLLERVFNTNYFKLLRAVVSNHIQGVHKCLYELNIDPRGQGNHLYHLSRNSEIKGMILDVSIKKNFLQKVVISNNFEAIIGIEQGDLSITINDYINRSLL